MTRPVNYRHARARSHRPLMIALGALGASCAVLTTAIVLAVVL